MKKQIVSFLLVLPLLIAPWACKRPSPTGPGFFGPVTPTMTPTVTLTPITTPVCGFTLISLGTRSMAAQPSVIRSLADWQTFCSYPTGLIYPTPVPSPTVPAPPVDLSAQMLIVYMVPMCPSRVLNVTGVCEDPGQVDVYADNVDPCLYCNAASPTGSAYALVVPRDDSPVVYHITDVPCTMVWGASPTPTP